MITDVLHVLAAAGLGGVLVVAFAVLAETLSPKRSAGVFAAAPSVALGSLLVTLGFEDPAHARAACAGMTAGALGFVVYCLLAPSSMRRWGPRNGAAAALVGWFAVAAAALPAASAVWPGASAAAVGASRRDGHRTRPRLRCDPGTLRETSPRDWLTRFAFGAGTSALAAVVSATVGPLVGGAFLAFPAILLASLTLVAQEDGPSKSRDDARGATAGAVGLLAFAAVGAALFGRASTPVPIAAATAAWVVVALGLYLAAWAAGRGADEQGADEQG